MSGAASPTFPEPARAVSLCSDGSGAEFPVRRRHAPCRVASAGHLALRAFLVALLVASLAACGGKADLPILPADLGFRTLDGERLTLADMDGPVLVNFWSTDCVVCLREMPALVALRQAYAPQGFELIAVAMPFDRPDAVLELARERDLPFPVAIDIDGQVLAAFEPVAGTPTSFLVDRDGDIMSRHVGALDLPAFRDTLDALLLTNERVGLIDADAVIVNPLDPGNGHLHGRLPDRLPDRLPVRNTNLHAQG